MLKTRSIAFDRPPVIETVLGVQFEPIPALTNAFLGIFWKRLGDEWLRPSDLHPLQPQYERFDGRWEAPGIRVSLSQDPSSRLQIRNTGGDRMIQLQNGRLHYNWLRKGTTDYPRYARIRPEFDRVLSDFRRFLVEESLGSFSPDQWEITYLNHFLKGTVWSDLSNWSKIFRGSAAATVRGIELESLGCDLRFLIPPERGRLHVEIKHGRAGAADGPDIVGMKLTARGPIGRDASALEAGLDLGHETIVTAFVDLTSEEAHRYWGIREDD